MLVNWLIDCLKKEIVFVFIIGLLLLLLLSFWRDSSGKEGGGYLGVLHEYFYLFLLLLRFFTGVHRASSPHHECYFFFAAPSDWTFTSSPKPVAWCSSCFSEILLSWAPCALSLPPTTHFERRGRFRKLSCRNSGGVFLCGPYHSTFRCCVFK